MSDLVGEKGKKNPDPTNVQVLVWMLMFASGGFLVFWNGMKIRRSDTSPASIADAALWEAQRCALCKEDPAAFRRDVAAEMREVAGQIEEMKA